MISLDKEAAEIGDTVTVATKPDQGFLIKSVFVNGTETTPTDGVYSFAMPAEVTTVSAEYTFDEAHFSQDGDTCTILDEVGWHIFADLVNDPSYNSFAGKNVKLADGFSGTVIYTVGSRKNPFKGTFDGNGQTLDVKIEDYSNYGTAPFRAISGGAVIKTSPLQERLSAECTLAVL